MYGFLGGCVCEGALLKGRREAEPGAQKVELLGNKISSKVPD